MGARPEEYEKAAPYKSYIYVDQFKGPKVLAEYLIELDNNDQKYNEYFQVRPAGHCINEHYSSVFTVERFRRVYKHKICLQSVCLAS